MLQAAIGTRLAAVRQSASRQAGRAAALPGEQPTVMQISSGALYITYIEHVTNTKLLDTAQSSPARHALKDIYCMQLWQLQHQRGQQFLSQKSWEIQVLCPSPLRHAQKCLVLHKQSHCCSASWPKELPLGFGSRAKSKANVSTDQRSQAVLNVTSQASCIVKRFVCPCQVSSFCSRRAM